MSIEDLKEQNDALATKNRWTNSIIDWVEAIIATVVII